KAGTDDVRESRAFPLVRALVRAGVQTRVHDPVALPKFQAAWENGAGVHLRGVGDVEYRGTVASALEGADLAVLHTDWPIYREWRRDWTDRMAQGILVDLRRCVPPARARRAGLRLVALGVGNRVDRPAPAAAPRAVREVPRA
ncbi:MAG TPA: UDP binding domain-containing protein, partial [Thermoplasmata archaeon]|nr:UDP binding domain-containing protein [Thermoplasmata archaeon]